LRVRKSQDIVIQRHLAAARTRPRARGKSQLSVGPQTEVPVPERVGDLAQELEAVEDEGQAVADETAPDLDLHVEMWRGRGAAVAELSQHLATANVLSDADSDGARLHVRVQEVDPRP